jgi:hypothetical protein
MLEKNKNDDFFNYSPKKKRLSTTFLFPFHISVHFFRKATRPKPRQR